MLGGLLPFGSISIELAVILSCVWNQRIYYVFGFLLLTILMTAVVCAEVRPLHAQTPLPLTLHTPRTSAHVHSPLDGQAFFACVPR